MKLFRTALAAAVMAASLAVAAGPAAAAPACGSTVTGYVVLTADLNCAGTDGLVAIGSAYINLNGHTIDGDDTPGTVGIRATSGDVYVIGGTVTDFGDGVVAEAGRLVIRNVTTSSNLGDGLRTDPGTQAVIANVTATNNGDDGIEALGAVADQGGNTASGNGGDDCVGVTCA